MSVWVYVRNHWGGGGGGGRCNSETEVKVEMILQIYFKCSFFLSQCAKENFFLFMHVE